MVRSNIFGNRQSPTTYTEVNMLVLQRKVHERILVRCPDGTELWVQLVDVRDRSKARIGIEAPEGYEIVREELLGKQTEAC